MYNIEKEFLAEESGLDGTYDNNISKEEEQYMEWYYINEEQILLEIAESGADRELDFNLEEEFDKRYEKYLASLSNK